jgi:hypothetical protein
LSRAMPTSGDEHEEFYPLPKSVECPFCRGTDTYLQTPFGSVLSVAQYYCRKCRTPFEWMKRQEGPSGRASGADT